MNKIVALKSFIYSCITKLSPIRYWNM